MRQNRILGHVLAAFCAGTLLLGLTTPAAAADEVSSTDRAAAQALFDEARQLISANKLAEACPKLEESARIAPLGGTLLNLADCYEKQGRLATAWSTFLRAASASNRTGNAEREQEARTRAAALAPQLPKLQLNVDAVRSVSGLEIKRDDAVVGNGQWGVAIPMDPGVHQVTVAAPAYRPWNATVETKAGELTKLDIPALEADSTSTTTSASGTANGATVGTKDAAPANQGLGTRKTIALVAGGVGVAGVLVGSVFGFVSLSKHDKADKACPGGNCTDSTGVDLWDSARLAGNVSTVGFIVGGVGLAAGATLWFTAPKTATALTAIRQVALGPGRVMVRGDW